MQDLATRFEGARIMLSDPDTVAQLSAQQLAESRDVHHPDDPELWFYGLGLFTEVWGSGHEETLADQKSGQAFAHDHTLNLYSQRIEARNFYFAGRDGLSWAGNRKHGAAPLAYCWRTATGDDIHVGPIVNALSRLTNSLVPEDVPIAPAHYVDD